MNSLTTAFKTSTLLQTVLGIIIVAAIFVVLRNTCFDCINYTR